MAISNGLKVEMRHVATIPILCLPLKTFCCLLLKLGSFLISVTNFALEVSNIGDVPRKIEIPEPALDEWEINNNLRPPKKNKKRHPSAVLWE